MTWVIKHKRSPGALVVAEYLCPVHGRFEREVERDANGDPPAELACPRRECEVFDVQVFDVDVSGDVVTVSRRNVCGRTSPHVISAPARCRVQRVTAARRGKDPEPPPGAMDWRALAYDEMDPDDWEKKERKRDFEDVHRIVKKALA